MKCLVCGGAMKTTVENYKYQSLPGVTLVNVRVDRCSACGESEVEIPRIEDLNKAVALAVISKHGRLNSAEIRFLRKSLGWSGADLARHMGAEPDTVSRWENNKQRIGPHTDRLLRLMVAVGQPVESYQLDSLEHISDKPEKLRLALHADASGWTAESAAA